ncbi:MAG: Dyp-type peroxidase [Cytophagales bacterium]|nr:Dyp-type peroxidase [Armatimonadota bacterium]
MQSSLETAPPTGTAGTPPPSVTANSSPPIRETPAPEPNTGIAADPSHPAVTGEPVLAVEEIQGNILGGFSKDYQRFLFYRITDTAKFRVWLTDFVPFVATSAEVIAFNRLFKSLRSRQGEPDNRPPTLKATWRNIAFTHAGLKKLETEIPDLLKRDFVDEAFREGMAARAQSLGDPVGSGGEGDPARWKVGGATRPVDLVLQIASDSPRDLQQEERFLKSSIQGVALVWDQHGENLPKVAPNGKDLAGHEHFGFLDGVSQPGIRGRVSTDPHDVLTSRQNPNNRGQGKPGQDLLWPGEFVFGYPGQDGDAASIAVPGPLPDPGPAWAVNGSFLVFRRLHQDVARFHTFLHQQAGPMGMTSERLGAKLVGRWESGSPILRTEAAGVTDISGLGDTDCANNHFEFGGDTGPIPAQGIANPFDCGDSEFPASAGDFRGALCPFAGHIRKTYPRDDIMRFKAGTDGTPQAVPACEDLDPADALAEESPVNEESTQTHRLLRRGIPYGKASASTFQVPVDDTPPDGRGLLFFAYQTSIVEQFEFVTRFWCNNPNFKDPQSGFDPIIGQNSDPGRVRTLKLRLDDGTCADVSTAGLPEGERDWVIPTGGGYFFAPSLSALRLFAAKPE